MNLSQQIWVIIGTVWVWIDSVQWKWGQIERQTRIPRFRVQTSNAKRKFQFEFEFTM